MTLILNWSRKLDALELPEGSKKVKKFLDISIQVHRSLWKLKFSLRKEGSMDRVIILRSLLSLDKFSCSANYGRLAVILHRPNLSDTCQCFPLPTISGSFGSRWMWCHQLGIFASNLIRGCTGGFTWVQIWSHLIITGFSIPQKCISLILQDIFLIWSSLEFSHF